MKVAVAVVVVLFIAFALFEVFSGNSGDSGKGEAGNGPDWKSFDEGTALASQEQKKLLIDVFTDWCSWCRKMDKEVYADASVQQVLKQQFIAVKLNAESPRKVTFNGTRMSERELARAIGVSGYPTTVFFEHNARLITLVPGFIPNKEFVDILRFIGEDHYRTLSYQDFLARKSR